MTEMPRSFVAQAIGINPDQRKLKANRKRKVLFNRIDFDADPAKVPNGTGVIVVYENSEIPNGNILLRYSGYYRISGQLYFSPPQGSKPVSVYIAIYNIGPQGTIPVNELSQDLPSAHFAPILYVGNQVLFQGKHPSLVFNYLVRNIERTYYTLRTYYLTNENDPSTHSLVAGDNYNFLQVEYLSPIENY